MKTDIENGTYQGIPYKIYSHPDPSRLIFINHGVYGTKERILTMLGMTLAKLRYKVVAIDAAKHGERGEAPFSPRNEQEAMHTIFEVVKKTSEDIRLMYHGMFATSYPTFDILGISMGGYVAYHMTTVSNRVNILITLISSPDFTSDAKHEAIGERTMRSIETMDPAKHASAMRFQQGLALVGNQDTLIPKTRTFDFLQKNPELPLQVKTYDTDHQVVRPMQEAIVKFLKTVIGDRDN